MTQIPSDLQAVLDTLAVDDPWREKFTRQYLQIRGLGWEAMMLDKQMKQNAMAREVARRSADGTLGKPGEWAGEDEDGMGIRIGDEVHYGTVASPAAPVAAAQPSPVATQPTPASSKSTTGKLSPWLSSAAVIAASALGGGAAVPIGGAILDWWNSPPAVVAPAEPTPAAPPSLDHGGVTIGTFKVPQ